MQRLGWKWAIIVSIIAALGSCASTGEPDSGAAAERLAPAGRPEHPPLSRAPAPPSERFQERPEMPSPPVPELPDREPLTAAEQEKLDDIVSRMTLTELLGQRFVIFVPNETSYNGIKRAIRKAQPAGFILYPWNYETPAEARRLTAMLHEHTTSATGGIAPFITVDQEGGRVAAFRFESLVRLPSAHDLAYYGDSRFVEAAGYITGVQLRELGVNMNLAPVVDVFGDANDGIIGDRAFAGDAETVTEMGIAFMRGLHAASVMAVAKHFPGHGVSTVDSHAALPTSKIGAGELRSTHLEPFRRIIEAGVDVVMTAHILYPSIDSEHPATLSRRIIDGVLREKLGFGGVVMSDGVEMGALTDNYTKREIVRKALTSGIDLLLLFSRYDIVEIVEIARAYVAEGIVTVAQLRESARRVLQLKARYGLLPAVR